MKLLFQGLKEMQDKVINLSTLLEDASSLVEELNQMNISVKVDKDSKKQMSESEMRESLQQLFTTLSEASQNCEAKLLPAITESMLEIFKIFRTIKY